MINGWRLWTWWRHFRGPCHMAGLKHLHKWNPKTGRNILSQTGGT